MEVIIRPNAAAAVELVARRLAETVRAKPDAVLGLATGGTMEPVYARLAQWHRERTLDFLRCRTFNLDEYVGLPAASPNSYRYYMNRHLFQKVNLPPEHAHLPNGMAANLAAECERYEQLIRQAGGIDLQLLGLGLSGHIGFNEPLASFRARTRVEVLSPMTIRQNARLFPPGENVPCCAITMGIGTILNSRRCVLLALGPDKAATVAQALEGPLTSRMPASALQLHPDCTVVLDEAAASQLKEADYYRWVGERRSQMTNDECPMTKE